MGVMVQSKEVCCLTVSGAYGACRIYMRNVTMSSYIIIKMLLGCRFQTSMPVTADLLLLSLVHQLASRSTIPCLNGGFFFLARHLQRMANNGCFFGGR